MAIDHEARIHRDADGVPIYFGRWGWALQPPNVCHPFEWQIFAGRIRKILPPSQSGPYGPLVVLRSNDNSTWFVHIENLYGSRDSAEREMAKCQAESDREREERERSIHERIKAATNGDDDE